MSHNFPDHLFEDIDFTFTDQHKDKLTTYVALLHKWQKAINLVSNKTLSDSWLRHIVDSAQLAPLIRSVIHERGLDSASLLDLGSGAGFPAMVLAMLCEELSVSVAESDSRKCSFIRTVSRETSAPIEIHNERIEGVIHEQAKEPILNTNIITARALASLSELLAYTAAIWQNNKDLRLFLPKGQKSEEEIREALKSFEFEYISHPSITDKDACILELFQVKQR